MRRVLARTFDDPKIMPEMIRLDRNIEEAAATTGAVQFFGITADDAKKKKGWHIADGRGVPIKENPYLSTVYPTKGGNVVLPDAWQAIPGLIGMIQAG